MTSHVAVSPIAPSAALRTAFAPFAAAGDGTHCEVGTLVMDCTCWKREQERERAAPSGRSLAQRTSDQAACIDRGATADRHVKRAEGLARSSPGIDADAWLACQHRVIASDMPAEDLLDHGSTRAAISQRCKPTALRR